MYDMFVYELVRTLKNCLSSASNETGVDYNMGQLFLYHFENFEDPVLAGVHELSFCPYFPFNWCCDPWGCPASCILNSTMKCNRKSEHLSYRTVSWSEGNMWKWEPFLKEFEKIKALSKSPCNLLRTMGEFKDDGGIRCNVKSIHH